MLDVALYLRSLRPAQPRRNKPPLAPDYGYLNATSATRSQRSRSISHCPLYDGVNRMRIVGEWQVIIQRQAMVRVRSMCGGG
jgi:hypothetical protein